MRKRTTQEQLLEETKYELELEMKRNDRLIFENIKLKEHINKLSTIIVDLTNERNTW